LDLSNLVYLLKQNGIKICSMKQTWKFVSYSRAKQGPDEGISVSAAGHEMRSVVGEGQLSDVLVVTSDHAQELSGASLIDVKLLRDAQHDEATAG
jgi:hypothetical protein